MQNPSKYQLFIRTNCSCCDKVINGLEIEKIAIPTTNVDLEDYKLPFNLMILPALVKDEKLISYGCEDIISYLKTV
jgi:hypothetical protein